ncbi:MAG: DUF2782 domain-containing protein [Methylophilaceae bacterium]
MKRLLFILLLTPLFALSAPPPPNLEELPEPPPAPAGYDESVDAPEITILKKGEDTVEEYRIGGELYMQKVTPSHGVPYYLVKQSIDGGWAKMDGPGDRIAVPQWVIFRF